jgi:hypothetical protein
MNTSDHSFGEEALGLEANTFHSRYSQQSYMSSDGGRGGHATDTGDSMKQSKYTLAREETKVVRSISWFLLGILIFFAIVIAGFVYVFTSRAERDGFEKEFLSNGNRVINAFSADSFRKVRLISARIKNKCITNADSFAVPSADASHVCFEFHLDWICIAHKLDLALCDNPQSGKSIWSVLDSD